MILKKRITIYLTVSLTLNLLKKLTIIIKMTLTSILIAWYKILISKAWYFYH